MQRELIATFSRFVLRAAIWTLDRFYEVGRVGEAIPAGPVLVIANHPNSVIDGLVVMKIAGRRVRPLARAPLFEQPLFGHVLDGLAALPVYRPQDFPDETWRNEDTFREAVAALLRGEAVLIFPEGLSHSEARLARIKTGAARLALEAEEAGDWELGLRVVPIGLTYHRKHAFRGRVAAAVGRPFEVAAWRESRRRDEWTAVESLTGAMRVALEGVTLNLPAREDLELIETAESLYAAEKGFVQPRSRARLAPRLPRLQTFAKALAWLAVTDHDRYRQLTASVRTYRRRLALLGVRQGELPERFPAGSVLRYTFVHGLSLLARLPLALLGTLVWYFPFVSPRLVLRLYEPPYEAVATVKLATALFVFPLAYAVWLGLAWFLFGLQATVATALALPFVGLVALWWRDRWSAVREDARVFWRGMRRRELRKQLVRRRQALVREFDRVALEWREETGGMRKGNAD